MKAGILVIPSLSIHRPGSSFSGLGKYFSSASAECMFGMMMLPFGMV